MQNISYKTSTYKEYQLNGGEIIRINVSDVGILTRFQNCKKKIENLSDLRISTPEDLENADKELRELTDFIFGDGISDKAFGKVNCLSITQNGSSLVLNFLRAFLPVVSADIKAATTAARITLEDTELNNEKTQKYLSAPKINSSIIPASKGPKALTDEQKAFLKELLEE